MIYQICIIILDLPSIQKVPSSPPDMTILGPLGLGGDCGRCCLNGSLCIPFLGGLGHLLDLLNSRHSCSCRHPVRVSAPQMFQTETVPSLAADL